MIVIDTEVCRVGVGDRRQSERSGACGVARRIAHCVVVAGAIRPIQIDYRRDVDVVGDDGGGDRIRCPVPSLAPVVLPGVASATV